MTKAEACGGLNDSSSVAQNRTRQRREFLQVQLLEIQRLRELAGNHPVMSISLAEREEELREELAALIADSTANGDCSQDDLH